eukprot:TRINITY_DN20185_c0_g1_i1.p1 TRINITY_DN20185_c0_g1~~TRINITY_DN20185_c0_g1_i1.p1  ORF type:complete len:196 (-),score=39.94 TRINITY_DN20185_c0_g1_i1:34-621(-)
MMNSLFQQKIKPSQIYAEFQASKQQGFKSSPEKQRSPPKDVSPPRPRFREQPIQPQEPTPARKKEELVGGIARIEPHYLLDENSIGFSVFEIPSKSRARIAEGIILDLSKTNVSSTLLLEGFIRSFEFSDLMRSFELKGDKLYFLEDTIMAHLASKIQTKRELSKLSINHANCPNIKSKTSVSYTHLTLPTIYSV